MSDVIKQFQNESDIKTALSISQHFKSNDDISVSLIQRMCKVGYNTASRTFEKMQKDGLIKNNKIK